MLDISARNELVSNNLTLARNLAWARSKTVSPCVQYSELLSAAYLGLIDAAEKYDEALVHEKAKYPFAAYARLRIMGEMTDYLRSCNWGGRKNPQKMTSLDAIVCGYADNKGFTQTESICDLEDNVIDKLNSAELFEKIIKGLPKLVKEVFRLRYLDDLTMKEIGVKLNISESRVSQIISQQTGYLKNSLKLKKSELWSEARRNNKKLLPSVVSCE